MADWQDTIAALATPVGSSGIGIIRLSGEGAVRTADRVFRMPSGRRLADCSTHTIHYGWIVDPLTDKRVDEVLVMLMLAPRSFTTENTVEINCHGGPYVLRRVLELVLANGARMAEPGEFTKRAFLNGRIDLSQAESVMDVIGARTDLSLEAAGTRLSGRLAERINAYRERLMDLLVLLEVDIDYPEYEIEEVRMTDMEAELSALKDALAALYRTADTGRMLSEGMRTAIIGRPNMGKSTLLNALLQEDRAIVTDIPGTTRDTLEESLNLDGVPLRLIDTAGLRRTDDPVEKLGVERSRRALEACDVVLLLLASDEDPSEEDIRELDSLRTAGRRVIAVRTKSDLGRSGRELDPEEIHLSAASGDGMDVLKEQLKNLALSGAAEAADGVYLANLRQKEAVREALEAVGEALDVLTGGLGTDMAATALQTAYGRLGEVTGHSVQEDLIDTIFARFCLGK